MSPAKTRPALIVAVWRRPHRDQDGDEMDLKQLRQRCAARVRDLDIPTPFDIQVLCEHLSERRGRPIQLLPLPLPSGGPCGLWVSTAGTDYIIYEESTSALHQEHIVLHEIGHLLCQHEAAPVLDENASRLLLPSLDPHMIDRVLGRTHYSAEEEREAETIASMILQGVSRWEPEPSSSVPPEAAGILERIERSLEHPPVPWRKLET